MKLIVGLGNPGNKYIGNRHNIGFRAIDQLQQDYNFPMKYRKKFNGEYVKGKIGAEDMILLKPQTYMNNSGVSVGEFARFFKIIPADIIVIHDELDLSVSTLRVKVGGGAGGHNGLKSIDSNIGKNYIRIRVGVDKPVHKDQVSNYVLSDFAKIELEVIENTMLPLISEYIDYILTDNYDNFMNKIALSIQKQS